MFPKRRVGHLHPTKPRATSQQTGPASTPPRWQLHESFARSHSPEDSFSRDRERSPEVSFPGSVLDGSGVAATPPVAKSGLEPVGHFGDDTFLISSRLTRLDTEFAQDASLPIPN
jgi:F-box and WD-40 domain protein CDC4